MFYVTLLPDIFCNNQMIKLLRFKNQVPHNFSEIFHGYQWKIYGINYTSLAKKDMEIVAKGKQKTL